MEVGREHSDSHKVSNLEVSCVRMAPRTPEVIVNEKKTWLFGPKDGEKLHSVIGI